MVELFQLTMNEKEVAFLTAVYLTYVCRTAGEPLLAMQSEQAAHLLTLAIGVEQLEKLQQQLIKLCEATPTGKQLATQMKRQAGGA